MASSNIARLGVVLGLDMAEFKANVDAAISEAGKLKNEIKRHSEAAVKELYALTNATNDYGKELSKVEQIQRETTVGRFASATQDMKDRLLAQAAAYDAKVAAEKKSFDAGKLTMAQQQALAYQTTDLVTQIASGQNALIAMLQQGGQLKDSMGGFSNMFKVLAAQITPFRVGLASAAAVIGTFAIAAYQGYQESDKLGKQLVLTGNYANLTQKAFLDLAATVSDKTNISIGKSRDILMQLVSSGKVSGDAMQSVAQAMATVSRFTGESAEEVSQRLIPALSGGSASIKELNDKMRFLTFEQYRQIAAMDKAGQGQQAMKIAADALNDKLKDQQETIGYLQQAWEAVGKAASWAWNAMMGIGRKLDAVGMLQKQIDDMTAVIESSEDKTSESTIAMTMQRDALQKQLDELIKKKQDQQKKDAEEAKRISLYEKAGGYSKELALDDEYLKLLTQNRYQKAILEANETQRIHLEAEQKIALASQEMNRKNRDENNVFETLNADILAQQIIEIEREKQEKLRQIRINSQASSYAEILRMEEDEARESQKKYEDLLFSINQRIAEETKSLQIEQERVQLQERMIGMTDKERAIAESRLKLAQEIKKVESTFGLSDDEKKGIIGRLMDQQAIREQNLAIIESVKLVEQAYTSVFDNMMSAVERFVRTGKMSFRDLARSIIQDLIMIQLRAQASSIFSMMMGSMFGMRQNIGASGYSDIGTFNALMQAGGLANGGPIGANEPHLVGERGPEIFMPSNSGTIIPNERLSSSLGGSTVVNNYNIQAIDVKSFEDRLMGSSNAIWAANLYAQKRLPLGAGRM